MNTHQILAVSTRLFAIWLFLYSISHLAGSYLQAQRYSAPDSLHPLFWGVGVVIFICGLLWYFPLLIAKQILPPSTTEDAPTVLFENWFSVGCSLIGLWVLVNAIPALASYFIGNYLGQKFEPDMFVGTPDWALLITFNVFQLLMGLWLLLGGKGLKKILNWARNA
ncbi:MAG: hypothetical protein R8K20_01380 [Gallionellaceae bacterium]